ncbi:hypothetical protein CBM2633_B40141 [Cupriavidus taiwanensis]|uniref:Uncharacterized protein n=1 Tax=Cupriavidus taiwanensis TaxID=164546 RepID=A0A375E9M5_9BURK|nr:hypothetical protein CBM2614_B50041 [Cupriavidus taiwanensis]SOZ69683.1 hypothetical protein CBM2615_B60042 [Cupriavidus taiwanensis]SOZ72893.1 hypothetical protein CBM2613_B50041 [Cupriavidus taiwanensis]SPA09750.1 hypothetical protein CBM2625_B50039 [Cupriavidus taiwanensis]SPA22014.1 hypothetical protein CBM2633_B40141 [Cupriavidus taiwanensis]
MRPLLGFSVTVAYVKGKRLH